MKQKLEMKLSERKKEIIIALDSMITGIETAKEITGKYNQKIEFKKQTITKGRGAYFNTKNTQF